VTHLLFAFGSPTSVQCSLFVLFFGALLGALFYGVCHGFILNDGLEKVETLNPKHDNRHGPLRTRENMGPGPIGPVLQATCTIRPL
jgi:hypothetical protein